FVKINTPKDLMVVVCVPKIITPARKTKLARSVIPKEITIKDLTKNLANACIMVSGFFLQDTKLLATGINDIIVEPARQGLIPGYDNVKLNAYKSGALAVTISGAGPSMIALTNSTKKASKIGRSMEEGFAESRVESSSYVCRPSSPARVTSKY
ncbi:MAG TPA: homoserine kinase, partial [Nitrososphaeraceae archaeon]